MEKYGLLKQFNEKMKERHVRLHGAVLMSGKKVIDEIYNYPYTKDTKTRMYSSTKSVTAIAIGKLITEGKLKIDEKVVDIFADRFNMDNLHENAKELTVYNMLTMQTAYSSPTYTANDKNWLETYFNKNSTHPCGTVWNYDSSGSYVLGAIVKQKTGQNFVDYLRPVFDEIGISEGVYCMEGPDGESWAPSALIATTADLAKIAYLMLEKGNWNGKQLIAKDFAVDAISPLVRNDDGVKCTRFDCGYGYQIWSHPNGGFAFRGLGGQVAIGFRGRDLVFSCTADTSSNNTTYDDIFNAVEEIILPHFPIIDKEEYESAFPKRVVETVFDKIEGKKIALSPNNMNIDKLWFEREGEKISLFYSRLGNISRIDFRLNKETEIIFPEKYSGKKLFDPDYFINYKCTVEAKWLTQNKLYLRIWAEDLFVGNMSMCFAFREDGKVGIKMQKTAQFFFDDLVGFAGGKVIEEI